MEERMNVGWGVGSAGVEFSRLTSRKQSSRGKVSWDVCGSFPGPAHIICTPPHPPTTARHMTSAQTKAKGMIPCLSHKRNGFW